MLAAKAIMLTSVLFKDPLFEIIVNGLGKGGQSLVQATDLADEGDQGGEFILGLFRFDLFQTFVGLPDCGRGKQRFVLFEVIKYLFNHFEGNITAVIGLIVEDGEGLDLILMFFQVGTEIFYDLFGLFLGAGLPFRLGDGIEIHRINDLLVLLADIFQIIIEITIKGLGRLDRKSVV